MQFEFVCDRYIPQFNNENKRKKDKINMRKYFHVGST